MQNEQRLAAQEAKVLKRQVEELGEELSRVRQKPEQMKPIAREFEFEYSERNLAL
jgi:hypothetical protein